VGSAQSFSRQSRLLNKHDFGRVFGNNSLKASGRFALLLALPTENHYSRLGLIVAKKHVRQAVQRNRIKRLVREFFRHQQTDTSIDVVFLARNNIDTLTNRDIQTQLEALWRKLQIPTQR
jgi:ribonuclease P protein component